MPWIPKGKKFHDWPKDATDLPIDKVIELYENGFMGAKPPTAKVTAAFQGAMLQPDGEQVAHASGIADTGAGKLVIPFVHVLEMFPGCWPGKVGQATGDCVSWSTRNAALLTMCCDIVSGQPDEKSGKPEEKPDVSQEGIEHGVLSSESFYWYRGHGGEGWFCPEAATIACKTQGILVRKDYTNEFGIDLTTYSGSKATKYGSRRPPESVLAAGKDHLCHQATEATTFEACRDLLYNGYGITTCGGEGLSDSRDENGVSKVSGGWAHAMAYPGADDRDVIKQKYGGPLVLDLNSWAKWNRGGRDIFQSAALVPPGKKELWIKLGIVNPDTGNIMIPEGSCWVRYSEMKRREMIAFSGVNGWPKKKVDPLVWIF